MKNITQDTIRDIKLPVPPIREQRAIMAKVSKKLSLAAPLTTGIDEQLAALGPMPTMLLRAAFAGGL
jgi:restriction endonuclease S subunit